MTAIDTNTVVEAPADTTHKPQFGKIRHVSFNELKPGFEFVYWDPRERRTKGPFRIIVGPHTEFSFLPRLDPTHPKSKLDKPYEVRVGLGFPSITFAHTQPSMLGNQTVPLAAFGYSENMDASELILTNILSHQMEFEAKIIASIADIDLLPATQKPAPPRAPHVSAARRLYLWFDSLG